LVKNEKKIHIGISIIALLFPVGYLMGVITANIAFPAMFTLIGCLQLFHGFFIVSKESRLLRLFSILTGLFFIFYGLFVVLPTY